MLALSGENSSLHFKAYEMGVDKWQGRSVDVVWLDEEPSRELYSQAVTRTLDRKGMVYMTFTPESGYDRDCSRLYERHKERVRVLQRYMG